MTHSSLTLYQEIPSKQNQNLVLYSEFKNALEINSDSKLEQNKKFPVLKLDYSTLILWEVERISPEDLQPQFGFYSSLHPEFTPPGVM